MSPESKKRFRMVEEVVDEVLRPLGFKKNKAIWRRNIGETLQQFSIVTMQLNDRYQPYWGLNILSRCEDPTPLPWKLSVQWLLKMTVKDAKRSVGYLECFKFGLDMPEEVRRERITDLLQSFVIPCFENTTTEETVRRMMGDRKYPMRAQSYVRLPFEWWPEEQRKAFEKSSGKPAPPPIIRRFDPNRYKMDDP